MVATRQTAVPRKWAVRISKLRTAVAKIPGWNEVLDNIALHAHAPAVCFLVLLVPKQPSPPPPPTQVELSQMDCGPSFRADDIESTPSNSYTVKSASTPFKALGCNLM